MEAGYKGNKYTVSPILATAINKLIKSGDLNITDPDGLVAGGNPVTREADIAGGVT